MSYLAWFKVLSGTSNWNNSGTANPGTGTGGLDVSGLAGGPYFICATTGGTTGSAITLNAGGSAFLRPVSSGFSAWDATAVWNGSDKTANITLSGSNLVATTTTNSQAGLRSTQGKSTGKKHFELLVQLNAGGTVVLGMANASFTLNNGGGLGADANGVGGYPSAGTAHIYLNGSSIGSILTFGMAQPVWIAVEVDLGGNLIWFAPIGGGFWNGNPSADPATGVGGIDLSALSGTAMGPIAVLDGATSDSLSFNFGQSAFTGTPPTGYTHGWPGSGSGGFTAFDPADVQNCSLSGSNRIVSAGGCWRGFLSNPFW